MRIACLVAALVLSIATPAHAGPDPTADLLGRAGAALRAADYPTAEALAAQVLAVASSSHRQDRAEAWRIRGVALYFLDRRANAERAFVSYLELDPEGHLDPVRVPPACIVFFEDVRARNAAAIAQSRPGPRRYFLLNFVPPGGQIQNGDTTKAWLIGGGEAALLAANITTFFVLRNWCDRSGEDTCDEDGKNRGRTDSARVLQGVNIATGAAFIALYVYGVIDGIVAGGEPKDRDPSRFRIGIGPSFAPTFAVSF